MHKDTDKMLGNVAIAAGGSGGHIFPGIAVAQALSSSKWCKKIIFLGREEGIEKNIIQEYGFAFFGITASGFVEKNFFERFQGSWRLISGIIRSIKILREQEIQLVLGTGSYVSVPVVLAARYLKLPVILQEQNVIPGKANRFLAHFAEKICISYVETQKYFSKEKCLLTGNPVRREILNLKRKAKNQNTTLLILGGSQGARAINEAVCEALLYLKDYKFNFIHQTGNKDFSWVKAFYEKNNIVGEVVPFLRDMAYAYAQADLVISRAGATTLAELILLGLPSILVPYPWAIGHQLYNAKVLADAGAAVIIPQKELSGKKLAEEILKLTKRDNNHLKQMSLAALSLATPEAAERIANLCFDVLKGRMHEFAVA